jgi:hypothetical protein
MGLETGVDLMKVVEAGHFISSALNRYRVPVFKNHFCGAASFQCGSGSNYRMPFIVPVKI